MRLKPIVAMTAAVLFLTGCEQGAEQKAPADAAVSSTELTTQEQKISYIFGQNIGGQFQADGVAIDVDSFVAGINDAIAGNEPKLGEEETMAVVQQFQEEKMAEQQAEFDAMSEKNKTEGEAFLAENATKEGVVTLESGLQYKVITEGEGPIPTAESEVEVHYKGTLLDGTEFDSSYKRGVPATFGVTQVIPGWTEALSLMKEGSKWEVYIPASLAYGSGGAGAMIGPEQTLIFEVELLKANAADESEEKPGEVTESAAEEAAATEE